ncbi:hypothetical protein DFJ74DRAFT_463170 [Hyaloraphidium curvatum]|nr:hypothetical protein DFJ74DRAFT_463170 [Hyaloraphidium curvatum]
MEASEAEEPTAFRASLYGITVQSVWLGRAWPCCAPRSWSAVPTGRNRSPPIPPPRPEPPIAHNELRSLPPARHGKRAPAAGAAACLPAAAHAVGRTAASVPAAARRRRLRTLRLCGPPRGILLFVRGGTGCLPGPRAAAVPPIGAPVGPRPRPREKDGALRGRLPVAAVGHLQRLSFAAVHLGRVVGQAGAAGPARIGRRGRAARLRAPEEPRRGPLGGAPVRGPWRVRVGPGLPAELRFGSGGRRRWAVVTAQLARDAFRGCSSPIPVPFRCPACPPCPASSSAICSVARARAR